MISKSDHGPSSLESHFQQEVFPTQVDLLDIGRPMQEEKVAIIATGESSITNSYEPSMFDDFWWNIHTYIYMIIHTPDIM